jgi:single-strand DNA-binding protein
VYIEGRLTPDKETGGPRLWTRQDGRPAASFEVTASFVEFLGGGEGASAAQPEAGAEEAPEEAETNIPF